MLGSYAVVSDEVNIPLYALSGKANVDSGGGVPGLLLGARKGLGGTDLVDGADAFCNILHVDMDAFFAAVEVLDDPSLAGKAVIVGGTGNRGVVASCTYEARSKGVRSAMPTVEARRRCPEAVLIPGRYQRYLDVSSDLHKIFESCSSVVEGIGLDEAFLDVTGVRRLIGTPLEVAAVVRQKIRTELGLTCSVGVARTKMIAKIASKKAKPKQTRKGVVPGVGILLVKPEEEKRFLEDLSIREIWGVGPATAERLGQLGISTVGELAVVPPETMRRVLGSKHGHLLSALARGEDARVVEPRREAKSIGNEMTFPEDIDNMGDLKPVLIRLVDSTVSRLRQHQLYAKSVTLKVRYGDLRTVTRSFTFGHATDLVHTVAASAENLLGSVDITAGIRLLGVSLGNLQKEIDPQQLSFESFAPKSGSGGDTRPRTDASGSVRKPPPGEVSVQTGIRGSVDRSPEAEPSAISEADESLPAGPEGSGQEGGESERSDSKWRDVEQAVGAVRERFGHGALTQAILTGPSGSSSAQGDDSHWGPADPKR